MRISDGAGGIVPAIGRNPLFSKGQLARIRAIVDMDDEAEIVGLDGKMRPVVWARLGGATEATAFFLHVNGMPGDANPEIVTEWA